MDRIGIILCAAEERMFIPLMMWLQNHHDVSCVNMLACRDMIDVLSHETDRLPGEFLREKLHDLVSQTGASLIAVVDTGSVVRDTKGATTGSDRLSVARDRAQSWFPNLTVVGLSVDDRFRVMSDTAGYRRRAS